MPSWLQILLACGGSVVITLFITEVFNAIKRRHQRNSNMKEDEKREELKQVIRDELKPLKDDLRNLKKGTQAVLKHDLIEMYDYWTTLGYAPDNKKEEFESMYLIYHNLGENGVMDSRRAEFLELPIQPENQSEKQSENRKRLYE